MDPFRSNSLVEAQREAPDAPIRKPELRAVTTEASGHEAMRQVSKRPGDNIFKAKAAEWIRCFSEPNRKQCKRMNVSVVVLFP